MLTRNGIKSVPITVKNPQGNSVAERVHKVVGDMIRTQLDGVALQSIADANLFVDTLLASASLGLRATIHTTLGVSPGAAVFGRDMLLNLPVAVDWELVRQRRRAKMTYNNERENAKRSFKDYQVSKMVKLKNESRRKLAQQTEGPFEVTQVHANGNLTIKRREGVYDRINIRRVMPDDGQGDEE
jgi:hypothetical protein